MDIRCKGQKEFINLFLVEFGFPLPNDVTIVAVRWVLENCIVDVEAGSNLLVVVDRTDGDPDRRAVSQLLCCALIFECGAIFSDEPFVDPQIVI